MSQSPYISYMYSYPHKTAYREFKKAIELTNYYKSVTCRDASLYVHIPFCRAKCGYCNLFSEQTCNAERIDSYLNNLERQVLQLQPLTESLNFTSFAVGGGTPLLLSIDQLERIFNAVKMLKVSPCDIFTSIETSPEYADKEKLLMLKNQGVKRLSIGVQSFFDNELKSVKRHISVDKIEAALSTIAEIGFQRFNIDLIYGIKGQTVETFLLSLKAALKYNPNELFIYPLYIRQGTMISERESDEQCLEIYNRAVEFLAGEGFMQTSMRRFVRDGTVDLEYSCGDEVMVSLGCGGRSYLGELHHATPYAVNQRDIRHQIDKYIETVDFTVATNGFILDSDEIRRRYIIKNLMYYRGIDIKEYEGKFPGNITEIIETVGNTEWTITENGFLRLTADGLAHSDYIGQLFISANVKQKMKLI